MPRLRNALSRQQLRKISANLVRFSPRALTGAVLIFSPVLRAFDKINLIVGTALRGRPSPCAFIGKRATTQGRPYRRSEEHTSELQSRSDLVCRLLLETKKTWSTL